MTQREHFGLEYGPGRMDQEGSSDIEALSPCISTAASGTLSPPLIWFEHLCMNVCMYCYPYYACL